MKSENPFKFKKCPKCQKLTYYDSKAIYCKPEERNPINCAYCGAKF